MTTSTPMLTKAQLQNLWKALDPGLEGDGFSSVLSKSHWGRGLFPVGGDHRKQAEQAIAKVPDLDLYGVDTLERIFASLDDPRMSLPLRAAAGANPSLPFDQFSKTIDFLLESDKYTPTVFGFSTLFWRDNPMAQDHVSELTVRRLSSWTLEGYLFVRIAFGEILLKIGVSDNFLAHHYFFKKPDSDRFLQIVWFFQNKYPEYMKRVLLHYNSNTPRELADLLSKSIHSSMVPKWPGTELAVASLLLGRFLERLFADRLFGDGASLIIFAEMIHDLREFQEQHRLPAFTSMFDGIL